MLAKKVCDYIETIDGLDTAYDVFKCARKLGQEFGADRFSILAVDNGSQNIAGTAVVNNWDPELLQVYDGEGLMDGSPVLDHCRNGDRPMDYFMDTLPMDRAAARKKLTVELFNDFGMQNGLVCPVVANGGLHGGVSFASPNLELEAVDFPQVHLLSNYLFNRITAISDYSALPGQTESEADLLSPREKECLTWAAAGKTAQEIGIILEISTNTVTHYLTTAGQKLNATNRVHAVAEAIRRRLLD